MKKLIPLLLPLWLIALTVHVQSYSINWYKVSGAAVAAAPTANIH